MTSVERLAGDRYEALVIGSGFGGAVTACRLAQAGIDVAIVERGRRWRPGTFPRDLSKLDSGWLWLCNYGLYDARPLNDILAVQAAGYGGGSLVYANVAVRPPPEVFTGWPAPYSRQMLDPYFDLAAHMLEIQPVGADPDTGRPPPKTEFMAEAARRMGNTEGFFQPNLAVTFADRGPEQVNRFGVPQRSCTFVGECDIGCNVGAKNSLDHNYLAVAERHGAAVATLTEAVHIGRTADGYVVRLREHGHPGVGKEGVRRDVHARQVFVCAGALGSTELLLRSRDQYATLPDLPPSLGMGYSGNGDFLSFGHLHAAKGRRFAPGEGPTITTASVLHTDGKGEEHWFVLEDGGYSWHLARLVSELDVNRLPADVARSIGVGTRRALAALRGIGTSLAHRTDDTDTVVLLAMGRDRADGRIRLRGGSGRLAVSWDTPSNDPLYTAERIVSADLVRAFDGQPFTTPTWRLFRQPVTVHNLGGARMGTDPATAVVDPYGEVFAHPGLYVLDGAALPGATGGNPSMTIAAVAEHCVEHAIRHIGGDVDWVAPQRRDAVRGAVPEDAAVDWVRHQVSRRVADEGVRFREVMRGAVTAPGEDRSRTVTIRLTVRIDDLHEFLRDPVHAARIGGTVQVAGMTVRPVPVDLGSLHILAAADVGPGRTMNYMLPFDDDTGQRWWLQGTKHVERRGLRGPWRAITELDLALTRPQERYDRLVPTGRATITLADALRLATTLRPVGTCSPAGVARFAAFFTAEVAKAFMTPNRGSPALRVRRRMLRCRD
jgi:cholesterol oxidase